MIGSKITLLAASGLLVASMGVAGAQTKGPASADQGKCWDVATKQIKDKSAMSGSASGSADAKAGAGTTGSGSAMSGNAKGSASGSASADRPAAAAGLPNC